MNCRQNLFILTQFDAPQKKRFQKNEIHLPQTNVFRQISDSDTEKADQKPQKIFELVLSCQNPICIKLNQNIKTT